MTVVWGLCDTVSPPRVASYVWNQYLMLKPGGNRLYFIPDANHYLQADRPDAFVKVLLHALGPAGGRDPAPSDRSRELPCWSIPLANGCPPRQACSAQKIPPTRTEDPWSPGRYRTVPPEGSTHGLRRSNTCRDECFIG